MLRMYRDVTWLAARRAAKAWPVAFSLLVYGAVMIVAGILAAPLGIVGGILVTLVGTACVASYLHLLSLAVDGTKVQLSDLKHGVVERFWEVMSVLFALWILGFARAFIVQAAGDRGVAVGAVIGLAAAFFLNPLPELLYQSRTRSFELLMSSVRFVHDHPLSWLLPNLVFAAVLLAPTGGLSVGHPAELLLLFSRVFSTGGLATLFAGVPLWWVPISFLAVHFVFVFRGLLFRELQSGNPRRAAWQAQTR